LKGSQTALTLRRVGRPIKTFEYRHIIGLFVQREFADNHPLACVSLCALLLAAWQHCRSNLRKGFAGAIRRRRARSVKAQRITVVTRSRKNTCKNRVWRKIVIWYTTNQEVILSRQPGLKRNPGSASPTFSFNLSVISDLEDV
jgi:hypothetical protein